MTSGRPTPEPEAVAYTVRGRRAHITLDRQQTRNALAADTLASLAQAVQRAVADDEVRLIVLDHRGPVFCSGIDLGAAVGVPPEQQPVVAFPLLLQQLWACPKPLVAMIAGKARAGGVGLLAACDLTIATTASDFAVSEVRLGLAPAVISVPVLARMRPNAVRVLFLTGDVFGAERAQREGLVDVVSDDPQTALDHYSDALLRGGPGALAATKTVLRQESARSLADRYDGLSAVSAALFAAAEGQEGIAARREKRSPAWVDRGPTRASQQSAGPRTAQEQQIHER